MFGKGISRADEILDLGVQLKSISKVGAWYNFNGEKLDNGREKSVGWLEEHTELADDIAR